MIRPLHEVWPLVVVGAGAAGVTAGIFAGRAKVRTLVLDTRRHPGAKIRASGGGRCNVLPVAAHPNDFFTRGSRHFVRNTLASWPLDQMLTFFQKELGLPLLAEAPGKYFPKSDDARDVVRVLMAELERVGATLRTAAKVTQVVRPHDTAPVGSPLALHLADGEIVYAERCIMATGGLSMPTTGSDGAGLHMMASLGHTVLPTAPALVPLTGQHGTLKDLSGIAVEASLTATVPGRAPRTIHGPLLFTHKGYSGPAVLDISQDLTDPHVVPGAARLTVGFGLPARFAPSDLQSWQQRLGRAGARAVNTVLRESLPRRLVEALVAHSRLSLGGEERASELVKLERARLLTSLTALPLPISGSEGYKTAEVTQGGVSVDEVYGKTLESRLCPGLYLCGEMLDVIGRLGGFNFLWAWASGRKAGEAAAHSILACEGVAKKLAACG